MGASKTHLSPSSLLFFRLDCVVVASRSFRLPFSSSALLGEKIASESVNSELLEAPLRYHKTRYVVNYKGPY